MLVISFLCLHVPEPTRGSLSDGEIDLSSPFPQGNLATETTLSACTLGESRLPCVLKSAVSAEYVDRPRLICHGVIRNPLH